MIPSKEQTDSEIELRQRVAELEDLLSAIQEHRVDAFLVGGSPARRILMLESAERPYRALIEGVQQGVLTLDENGRILFSNQRFSSMVGRDPRDLAGSALHELITPGERAGWEAVLQAARSAPIQAQLHLVSRASQRLPVLLSLNSLASETGAAFGVLITDLSSEIAQRELERESRRKEEFMAVLGHELRNPLGAARSAIALLRKLATGGEDQQRRACELVDRQIDLMTRLIDDLLDVERIAHGKVSLKRERVDLGALLRATCEDLRPEIETAGMRLETTLPERPMWAEIDPQRMAQIVANLLQNALKFSERGGSIRMRLELEGASALLHVEDDGAGMEPEVLERIFVPFQQGRSERGGLGLGLALVRGLVELHGGSIEAASDGPGRGARFTVCLPLRAPRR